METMLIILIACAIAVIAGAIIIANIIHWASTWKIELDHKVEKGTILELPDSKVRVEYNPKYDKKKGTWIHKVITV